MTKTSLPTVGKHHAVGDEPRSPKTKRHTQAQRDADAARARIRRAKHPEVRLRDNLLCRARVYKARGRPLEAKEFIRQAMTVPTLTENKEANVS